MRLRSGLVVESSAKAAANMEEDYYSTTAQWGSQPNSSFSTSSSQPAVSPMPDPEPSGSPHSQYAGQNPFLGLVDPTESYPHFLPAHPAYADDGINSSQNPDPYGTLPQDDHIHQEHITQTYNQTDHGQSSSSAELPRLQTSLPHTDSTNPFHTDSPPWSPEVEPTSSDSHQRRIPNIPGLDNRPSYHPPYDDKLQGDLRLMAQEHSHVQGYQDDQEHGFVHEDLDDEEREAEDEKERKNKRSKGKEKRKASSSPTQKRNKRERRDRDGGSGNRRPQAGRA